MEDDHGTSPTAAIDEIPVILSTLRDIREPSENAFGLYFDFSRFSSDFLQVPGQGPQHAHTDSWSNTSDDPNPSLSHGQSYTSSTSSFTANYATADDLVPMDVTLDQVKEGDDKLTTPQLNQGQFGDPGSQNSLDSDLLRNLSFSFSMFEDIDVDPEVGPLALSTPEPSNVGSPLPRPPSAPKRRPLGEKREKVAGMRKKRACVRCRIRKVECDYNTPCNECIRYKPNHPQVCEIQRLVDMHCRIPEAEIWRDSSILANLRSFGQAVPMLIRFEATRHMDFPLRLMVQQYTVDARPRHSVLGTANNFQETLEPQYCLSHNLPLPQDFMRWSEEQLSRETMSFRQSIGSFLSAYAKSSKNLPKKGLVHMVHEIRCWYTIWRSPVLWATSVPTQQARALSGVAHLQLRRLARDRFVSLERQVLEELDTSLPKKGFQSAALPVWASFWQLILLYRDLLGPYHQAVQQPMSSGSQPNGYSVSGASIRVFDDLQRLLIIHYAAYFRRQSPVYLGLKDSSEIDVALQNDHSLRAEFENVCAQRIVFRKFVSSLPGRICKILNGETENAAPSPADAFLREVIIKHEIALDKRRCLNKSNGRR